MIRGMTLKLEEIRAQIDEIDNQLLSLFLRRMELSGKALEQKTINGLSVLDGDREKQILNMVAEKSEGLGIYTQRLFSCIMSLSGDYQNALQGGADRNIVIIGMPGCGKTTVGKLVAQISGRRFVGIDENIESKTGRTIPDIFAQDGEAAFRKLESEEIRLCGVLKGVVIAAGGGSVKDSANYAPMHQNGRIYCLQRDLEKLATDGRPLSKDLDNLRILQRERQPLYDAFQDCKIDNNRTPIDAARNVWSDFLEKHGQ